MSHNLISTIWLYACKFFQNSVPHKNSVDPDQLATMRLLSTKNMLKLMDKKLFRILH